MNLKLSLFLFNYELGYCCCRRHIKRILWAFNVSREQ